MARSERVELIRHIEQLEGARLISYICSDRQGASGQIAEDAVRPMYDHVRRIGKVDKLDLFLYSRGGAAEVPWKIICMLREYCNDLGVLIPYRAQSAATLIALGCDRIVMGSKAELGPIDPALNRITQEGGTAVQEEVRVEDVMSYIAFIKDKAGLGDQAAIADNVRILAEKLTPQLLGSIYRTQLHIRLVARKLLTCHAERMDDQKVSLIIDSLAEKMYLHGHGVGRGEAEELGLPVVRPNPELENVMWQFLEHYESTMDIRNPVDGDAILGDADEGEVPLALAMIESSESNWAFRGKLRLRHIRQTPQPLNVNLNLGVSLPPGINPSAIPQEIINQLLRQMQTSVQGIVIEQVRKQSPILKTEGRFVGGCWQDVTA